MPITNNLGQTKVGIRTGVLAQQTSYLLDTYSGAAAAYSLRKLRNSYTGSAIRVRRSSDNTTLDVGFDANGNLDTTSMLNFVGANNQALYSEEFDNVYWSKYITTVAPNQTTAPDGTMTADLLAESSANNYHTLYNATSLLFAVGTSWNVSVYVKKGPGTSAPNTIILGFPSPTGNVFSLPCVLFNISSGTVLDSSNASNDANFGSSIVDAGNGWWRCSVWGTVTVAGNRSQVGVIRFNNNLNTLNTSLYPGNVQSNIYIWGYQFQKALNNTSVLTTQPYTKTTATALDGNGFVSIWYDQSGNGRDSNQTTSNLQPLIVNTGVVNTYNSKPCVKFDGNGDYIESPYNTGTSNEIYFVTQTADTQFLFPRGITGYGFVADQGSTISTSISLYTTTQPQLYVNSVLTPPANRGAVYTALNGYKLSLHKGANIVGFSYLRFGMFTTPSNSLDFNGNLFEWIIYPTLQSSQTSIESNINTYYSIY